MKTNRSQHGSVLIEMALLLTPLLVLAFGVTEFGRAMFQYNAIAKGVRDGARHLSQFAPGEAGRIDEARSLVLCGKLACGSAPPLVTGMSASFIRVNDRSTDPDYNLQPTGRGTVNLVRVEVSGFQFQSMAPVFVPRFTFAPIHVTMIQVL